MNEECIELIIPPEFAGCNNFQANRIKNDFLIFRTGLYKNCLAIFIPGEILQGALGVIDGRTKHGVDVGFASRLFGLVAFERPFFNTGYLETEIFDESEVEILGYSEPEHGKNNK
jgi:hypothetical protein